MENINKLYFIHHTFIMYNKKVHFSYITISPSDYAFIIYTADSFICEKSLGNQQRRKTFFYELVTNNGRQNARNIFAISFSYTL